MPKQKTHKGTAKRVRVTGTGKLMHEQTNNQHKFASQVGAAEASPRRRQGRLAGGRQEHQEAARHLTAVP